MNAYIIEVESSSTAEPSSGPILIAGSNAAALARATRTVEASGLRIADTVLIEDAAERFDRQISACAIWIEVSEDSRENLDGLLDRVTEQVQSGRCSAVVAATADLIDPVLARLGDPRIEIVIDGDDAARAAALAIAMAGMGRSHKTMDVAADRSAERLRQLSDEVSRIASTLARLSTGPTAAQRPTEAPASESPEVSADAVRAVIRARRLRSRFFSDELFADPAWDMLLDLLQAEIAQFRVPVSSLCIAAAVPATTALRWLKTMTEQGMFLRRADPHDGRRVFVELAPQASLALRRYFAEVGKVAAI
ncbi:MAG: hypothetical protein ABIO43_05475 [Sphingomicrobium sp.]